MSTPARIIARAIAGMHAPTATRTGVTAMAPEISSPLITAKNIKQKGEPGGSPFCQFAVSSRKRRELRVFSGDAHRKSGVFSCRATLSPVESCSLLSF